MSATASVVVTHLRPTWGGGWWLSERSSQLDAVGGDVGASSPWERRAGPNISRGGFKSAFLWGSTPFLCARAKKWGGMGSRGHNTLPNKTAHTYQPPTSTKPSPKSGEKRPVYRGSSAHANGGAARVKKALFFGGSTPFLWASTKEMGSNRGRGYRPPPSVSAHPHQAKDKAASPSGRCGLTRDLAAPAR